MRYADQHCSYTESKEPEPHTYTFTGPCMVTGRPYSVTVLAKELFAYRQDIHIQDAMPSVSAEDREFLISGTSPEGWKEVFGSEEEEETCDSERDSSSTRTGP